MRRARWISIAVLSLLFVVGPAGIAQAQSYEPEELQFLELINQYRAENGLDPLSLSAPLSVASERHSEDMGTYGFFSHTTGGSSYYPIGSGHTERISQEGYDYNTYTAENLAYGQTTAGEVFETWRLSPSHNTNMLGDYSVIGIGLTWVNGTPYWTTVFGAYVDPSASGGGASTDGTTTEAADQASANLAPQPPAEEAASDPAATSAPEATVQAIPETTSETGSDPAASSQKESAAVDQYSAKQSSDPAADPAAGRATEKQLTEEPAADDQYAEGETPVQTESTAREAAGATGPVAVENAPAEADYANTDEKRVDAAGTEPVAADNAAATESDKASATSAAESGRVPATAAISTLPDTGGVPLPLAGGLALLVVGSLVARRALR